MIPRYAPRTATPGALALFSLALLASVGCSGKGAEGSCAGGAVCDSSPAGVWDAVSPCQYTSNRSDQPLNPIELVQKPLAPTLTSSPIAQTTAGDWCSQLIYTPTDKVKSVNLWHDAPKMASGQVSFNPDYTYSLALNFSGYNVSHFAPYCLQASGVTPSSMSCETLATDLTAFYVANAGKDAAGNPLPDFTNIACVSAPDDNGCDCGYTYQVALTNKGAWNSGGSILTESSAADAYLLNGKSAGSQGPTSMMISSICQRDNALTLSGYNGSTLFHVPGLRVLTLSRHP